MKLIEKLKKAIIGIGTFLTTIPTRLFADISTIEQTLKNEEEKIEQIYKMWFFFKKVFIPFSILIGIIVYWKKSKKSKKNKIIISLVIILIAIFVTYYIDKSIFFPQIYLPY